MNTRRTFQIFAAFALLLSALMSTSAQAGCDQCGKDISATPAFAKSADDILNNPLTPSFGNPKGDVTIVEYFDYQCGYCKATEAGLEQLLQEDKNIRVVYKDFPKLGPFSTVLATATLASMRQGTDKYLKLHQALLAKHTYVSNEDTLYKLAASVGLDVGKLKQDMQDGAIAKQIQDNITVGKSVGVQIVPTFLINGYYFPGATDYSGLKERVDYVRPTQSKISTAVKNYAVSQIQSSAEKGDAQAESEMGAMYYYGRGVTQDYAEALKWCLKAANQGNASAEYNVGLMYDDGQGIIQNKAEALKWYQKAADQGNSHAQFNLGQMYHKGEGVTQDYAQALKWELYAADQGHAQAEYDVGVMYHDGQGVAKDDTQAFEWFQKAADQGLTEAQRGVGYMYAKGEGTPQNTTEAVKWLEKAAEAGDTTARFILGELYLKGEGVKQDNIKAYVWLQLAASRGDEKAKAALTALEKQMPPAQLKEAQMHSASWQPDSKPDAPPADAKGGKFVKVFDLLNSGFSDWNFPAFGLIFVVTATIGIGSGRKKFYPLLVFAILWTMFAFSMTYIEHRRHQKLVENNTCRVIAGPVENFVPMPYTGHAEERFSVSGVSFAYSDYVVTDGFNKTASHGGPINANSYVRLCYDPSDHAILRLEIRK